MDLKSKQLPANYIPHDDDVLCGRGSDCFYHVGNTRFRELIRANLERYSKAFTKNQKTALIDEIVELQRLRSPGGGFVKKNLDDGRYYEVGDFNAREKVSSAFRDALREQHKATFEIQNRKRDLDRIAQSTTEPILNSMAKSRTLDDRASNDEKDCFMPKALNCKNSSFPCHPIHPTPNTNIEFFLAGSRGRISGESTREAQCSHSTIIIDVPAGTSGNSTENEVIESPLHAQLKNLHWMNDIFIDPKWIHELQNSDTLDFDSIFHHETDLDCKMLPLQSVSIESVCESAAAEPMLLPVADVDRVSDIGTNHSGGNDPWESFLHNLQENEVGLSLDPNKGLDFGSGASSSRLLVSSSKVSPPQDNNSPPIHDVESIGSPFAANNFNPLSTVRVKPFALLPTQIKPFNYVSNDVTLPEQHQQQQQQQQQLPLQQPEPQSNQQHRSQLEQPASVLKEEYGPRQIDSNKQRENFAWNSSKN